MSDSKEKQTFAVILEIDASNATNAESRITHIMENSEMAVDLLTDAYGISTHNIAIHAVMPWDDAMKLLHPEEKA